MLDPFIFATEPGVIDLACLVSGADLNKAYHTITWENMSPGMGPLQSLCVNNDVRVEHEKRTEMPGKSLSYHIQ